MDHIGVDVPKRESQICILAGGGELIERRILTDAERFAAVLGDRPRARIVIEPSTDSEWVARCLEALGHEVVVADANLAPMCATRTRKVKYRSRGRARPGRRLRARRLSPGASPLRPPTLRARPPARPGRARPHPHAVHFGDPSASAPAGLARPLGQCPRLSSIVSTPWPCPGPLLSLVAPLLAVMRPLNRELAANDLPLLRRPTTVVTLSGDQPKEGTAADCQAQGKGQHAGCFGETLVFPGHIEGIAPGRQDFTRRQCTLALR